MSLNTLIKVGDVNQLNTIDKLTVASGQTLNLDNMVIQLQSAAYRYDGLYLLIEAVDGASALTGTVASFMPQAYTVVEEVSSYRSAGQLVVQVRRKF